MPEIVGSGAGVVMVTGDSSVVAQESITVEPGPAIVGLAPLSTAGVFALASGVTPITREASSVPVVLWITENFVAVAGLVVDVNGPVQAPLGLHDQIRSAVLSASLVAVVVNP